MLAIYSSLIKKESLIERIQIDAEELANIANDLVCEIKIMAASCKNKDAENLIAAGERAEKLSKIVNLMLDNVKNNSSAYINSLIPRQEEDTNKNVEKNKTDEKDQEQIEQQKAPDPNQITSILDAIKALKEMKDNLE